MDSQGMKEQQHEAEKLLDGMPAMMDKIDNLPKPLATMRGKVLAFPPQINDSSYERMDYLIIK